MSDLTSKDILNQNDCTEQSLAINTIKGVLECLEDTLQDAIENDNFIVQAGSSYDAENCQIVLADGDADTDDVIIDFSELKESLEFKCEDLGDCPVTALDGIDCEFSVVPTAADPKIFTVTNPDCTTYEIDTNNPVWTCSELNNCSITDLSDVDCVPEAFTDPTNPVGSVSYTNPDCSIVNIPDTISTYTNDPDTCTLTLDAGDGSTPTVVDYGSHQVSVVDGNLIVTDCEGNELVNVQVIPDCPATVTKDPDTCEMTFTGNDCNEETLDFDTLSCMIQSHCDVEGGTGGEAKGPEYVFQMDASNVNDEKISWDGTAFTVFYNATNQNTIFNQVREIIAGTTAYGTPTGDEVIMLKVITDKLGVLTEGWMVFKIGDVTDNNAGELTIEYGAGGSFYSGCGKADESAWLQENPIAGEVPPIGLVPSAQASNLNFNTGDTLLINGDFNDGVVPIYVFCCALGSAEPCSSNDCIEELFGCPIEFPEDMVTTSAVTNTITGNVIATHTDGNGTSVDIEETVTTFVQDLTNNTITYTDENGNPQVADLSQYVDTETVTTLTVNGNVITYTNEDGVPVSFTLPTPDVSTLVDDPENCQFTHTAGGISEVVTYGSKTVYTFDVTAGIRAQVWDNTTGTAVPHDDVDVIFSGDPEGDCQLPAHINGAAGIDNITADWTITDTSEGSPSTDGVDQGRFESWIYIDTNGTQLQDNNANTGERIRIWVDGSVVYLNNTDTSGGGNQGTNGPFVTLNKGWHYIVFEYSDGTVNGGVNLQYSTDGVNFSNFRGLTSTTTPVLSCREEACAYELQDNEFDCPPTVPTSCPVHSTGGGSTSVGDISTLVDNGDKTWTHTAGGISETIDASNAVIDTRAAILALRNSSSLEEGCHYIVTDPAVNGTLQVEHILLHATAPNELSGCYIKTVHDNTAWNGAYDIDTNRVEHVFDHLNRNDVTLYESTSTFPFGVATVQENHVHGGIVNYTAGTINECQINSSTLNMIAGSLTESRISNDSNVTIRNNNNIENIFESSVTFNQVGTGVVRYSRFAGNRTWTNGNTNLDNIDAHFANVNTTGTGGSIVSSRIHNSTISAANAANLNWDFISMDGNSTITANGAGVTTIQYASLDSGGRILVSAGAVLTSLYDSISDISYIQVIAGTLSSRYCKLNSLGYIQHNSTGSNRIDRCEVTSQSRMRFLGTCTNCRIYYSTASSGGMIEHQGSSTGCYWYYNEATSTSQIYSNNSVNLRGYYNSATGNSRIYSQNVTGTHYIYYNSCTGHGYIHFENAPAGRIYAVSCTSQGLVRFRPAGNTGRLYYSSFTAYFYLYADAMSGTRTGLYGMGRRTHTVTNPTLGAPYATGSAWQNFT